jgi:hypothetical protein
MPINAQAPSHSLLSLNHNRLVSLSFQNSISIMFSLVFFFFRNYIFWYRTCQIHWFKFRLVTSIILLLRSCLSNIVACILHITCVSIIA